MLSLARLVFAVAAAAAVAVQAQSILPTVTVSLLSEARLGADNARKALPVDSGGKISAFAVELDQEHRMEYVAAAASLRKLGPSCLGGNASLPISVLADGSSRTTFATETYDDFPTCLADGNAMTVLTKVFDLIEQHVITALETLTSAKMFYRVKGTPSGPTQSLSGSPHKDHIHVYSRGKSSSPKSDYLVPFHIDNGLFLIITPFPKHGLKIRLSDGTLASTDGKGSEDNRVIVVMGLALTEWLLQEDRDAAALFFPAPHAVESLAKSTMLNRTVFARMKVTPMNAVPMLQSDKKKRIITHADSLQTFGDVFFHTPKANTTDNQVCSVDLKSDARGAWPIAQSKLCSTGEAYCWMGCYPLPQSCPSPDLAKCYSSLNNVTCSTEVDGHPMDPTCKWECDPSKGVAPTESTSEFCNGRMSMLMFGFGASGDKRSPCIILFIGQWTLDTPFKFAVGCLGVAGLGFLIEALICFRRQISRRKVRMLYRMTAASRRLILAFCFGLNLVLGYLAMLVAMTYSVELFFSVVVGLVAGHVVFNSGSAVGETIDPCCASQNDMVKSKRESSSIVVNNGDNSNADVETDHALLLGAMPSPTSTAVSSVMASPGGKEATAPSPCKCGKNRQSPELCPVKDVNNGVLQV